jgi:hypothetical protein
MQGETTRVRWKAARRAFYNAGFEKLNRYSFEKPRYGERLLAHLYDRKGMNSRDLALLRKHIPATKGFNFQVLVLLLTEIPEKPYESAVVVVSGVPELRALRVRAGRIVIPAIIAGRFRFNDPCFLNLRTRLLQIDLIEAA